VKQLNLDIGRQNRERGIDLVIANNKKWFAAALQIIADLPAGWRGLSEDYRPSIEAAIGLPVTSTNVYGALTMRAVQYGLLVPTGRRFPMKRRASHGRVTKEYKRSRKGHGYRG
jgi:hypothetical protein